MEEFECTPWFHVRDDGVPVRPGVYEGALARTTNGSFTAFQGFYLWDGTHWVGFGKRPDAIRRGAHSVTYWRGVIPGKDYPFDQVAKPQLHYSGVLERAGAPDKLIIHRLTVKGNEMVVAVTRERGGREPEKYEAVLYKTGDGYAGSSKIRIGNYTPDQAAQLRIPSFVESEGRLTLSFLLQGVTPDWYRFDGLLSCAQ